MVGSYRICDILSSIPITQSVHLNEIIVTPVETIVIIKFMNRIKIRVLLTRDWLKNANGSMKATGLSSWCAKYRHPAFDGQKLARNVY